MTTADQDFDDVSATIAANSDQLGAEDLLGGPQIVTITGARVHRGDQPVELVTAEFGPKRPYKPCKTVRRILVAAWGKRASEYVGRRMMLYRDPAVVFGGQAVGGIRVSALSHLEERLTLPLTVTRGKRAPYVVEPLKVSFKPIPESFVAKVKAGGLSSEDQAKALEWLDKATESNPAEVAGLRALLEDGGQE